MRILLKYNIYCMKKVLKITRNYNICFKQDISSSGELEATSLATVYSKLFIYLCTEKYLKTQAVHPLKKKNLMAIWLKK